ncbi:tetratricopeptide repeat protein [Alphaproteobacteria bacterium]|nr:tetratricopeptide repeat protein [Alphaproteobacteria bacterium]
MELTIEQALQQGVAAHKEGKLQEAERLYRAILQSQPAHPDANHNLGVLAVSVNKTEAAVPLFKSALEANPKIEQFWLSYINALIKEKQFDNAKQIIEKAKKQGVSSERLNQFTTQLTPISQTKGTNGAGPSKQQINSLFKHYQAGRYGDAEILALSITKAFPKHQSAWKLLGAALKRMGRSSEAVNANHKAVQLAPQDAQAHYNLGVTLRDLGRLEEAEASYMQSIALRSDYAQAHNNLGNTLKELKKFAEAEASYRQAIALKSDYFEAHNNLGITLKELKRFAEAEASFRQAIKLKPDFSEAHTNLGITLKRTVKIKEAMSSYKQAILIKPNFDEAYNNFANILQEVGRLEEAEANYAQAIILKPDYPEAHNNLGVTLKEVGRLEEAEANYAQAIILKPDYPEAHNNLGVTLTELDRLNEARVSCKQAAILEPTFAKVYDNLGIILQRLDKLDDAERYYKKYLSIEPIKKPIMKSIASIFFDQGKFQTALRLFDNYNTQESRYCAFECLYALGKISEIYKRLEDTVELDDENLKIAAFATFVAGSQKKDTAHRFCRNPLELVYFSNLSSKTEDLSSFVARVIKDLNDLSTRWQPPDQSVRGGFQTLGDLFTSSTSSITVLKTMILNEIDVYYGKFKNKPCSFIEKWPKEKSIVGWHVILKEQGYNTFHIHESGWLSGVVYLQVAPSLNKNEGSIKFTVASPRFPDVNVPEIIHNPKVGDIVLFPSSLHHGTKPFSTDTERIIVSFDLQPKKKITDWHLKHLRGRD